MEVGCGGLGVAGSHNILGSIDSVMKIDRKDNSTAEHEKIAPTAQSGLDPERV